MDRTSHLPEEQIRSGVTGKLAKVDKESILESIRLDVHLLSADSNADAEVVLAPNHIERVRNREHIGPALEGSKPAITQRPVTTSESRSHSATDAVLC